jgi:hypothetical protein
MEQHTEHHFLKAYFNSPTWCSFCKDLVWGVAKKGGYRCSGNIDSLFVVHCLVDLLI